MPANAPSFRRAASACAAAAVLAVTGATAASQGDGAYGRLDGDLELGVGVAGGVIASERRPVVAVEARARYLQSAGVVLQYEEADAFARAQTLGDYRRGFVAAVELRPLFPIRFLKAMERGPALADLVLDSVGLEVGTFFGALDGSPAARAGLHLGLGVEVPLAARASGPWLRLGGALRWTAPRLEGQEDRGTRFLLLTVGLAWHQMVGAHLVDVGDRSVE